MIVFILDFDVWFLVWVRTNLSSLLSKRKKRLELQKKSARRQKNSTGGTCFCTSQAFHCARGEKRWGRADSPWRSPSTAEAGARPSEYFASGCEPRSSCCCSASDY